MSKKLIFLDIDGTLTMPGSNVPPQSALDAIRAAQKKGHKVFLCSGRNLGMLSPLLQYGFDGVVASAGGYVEYGGKVIYDHPMTDAQRDTAMALFQQGKVFRTIEAKDATYCDEDRSLLPVSGNNSEYLRWRAALEKNLGIQPLGNYDGRPIYKMGFLCRKIEQVAAARAALEDAFHFCILSGPEEESVNGELISHAFDKGKGIQRVCEYLGAEIRDTYGFGDSMNDLEMIQTAGTGVVMENGSEALKAYADYICPSVEADGLAQAFQKLGLIS